MSRFLPVIPYLILSMVIAQFAMGTFEKSKDGTLDVPGRSLPALRIVLPVLILSLTAVSLLRREPNSERVPSMALAALTYIFLYYGLLLVFLPLLRKRITATACAALWLLPVWPYLFGRKTLLSKPLVIVPLPAPLLRVLTLIWAVGTVAVLLWYTLDHLRFRSHILRHAVPVTDPEVLSVWSREVGHVGGNAKYFENRLVISPDVTTPLSVGLLHRGVRVVLPQRPYTPDELTLIFRHELVHLVRGDNLTKLSLLLYKAICWFNPLMWLAMSRSSADMERSCDELVLVEEPEEVRRQYAELVLQTAGTSRGLTTCLSASATALRERLRVVIHPQKFRPGGLVLTLTCMALFFSGGLLALRYDRSTLREVGFPADVQIETICGTSTRGHILYHLGPDYECSDPNALLDYLAGLTVDTLSDTNYPSETGLDICLQDANAQRLGHIRLLEHTLELSLTGVSYQAYYLPQEVDWDFLFSLLHEIPTTA